MQVARAVRLLLLWTAIVLGTSAALGCGGGGPTSPDQGQVAPSFAATKGPLDDVLNPPDNRPCPGGYELVSDPTSPYDENGNGFICGKKGGPPPKK